MGVLNSQHGHNMEVDSYDSSLESNLEDDPSRDWDAWSNGSLESSRVSSKGSVDGNEVKSTTEKNHPLSQSL